MTTKRPIAYFMPGPTHLFWTTGVFHLLQLGRTHDVVIFTDDLRYATNLDFQKIVGLDFVRDHIAIPPGKMLGRHLAAKRAFDLAAAKYQPDMLYLHNMIYVEELHLLRLAQRQYPDIPRYFYQNGRLVDNFTLDFQYRVTMEAQPLRDRLHITASLAIAIVRLRGHVLSALNYILFPTLLTGRPFRAWYNVYNGVITGAYCQQWNTPTDQTLAYVDYEADIYRKVGLSRVRVSDHPARTERQHLAQLLGRSSQIHDRIVILPSVGFTTEYQKTMTDDQAISFLTKAWSLALAELAAEYSNWPMLIKLHPSATKDTIWMSTVANLKAAFPQLTSVEPKVSAEALTEASRVIVGDVSSALWWASLIGDKRVISFDYFGYPGGDEMRSYDGIEVRTRRPTD